MLGESEIPPEGGINVCANISAWTSVADGSNNMLTRANRRTTSTAENVKEIRLKV